MMFNGPKEKCFDLPSLLSIVQSMEQVKYTKKFTRENTHTVL